MQRSESDRLIAAFTGTAACTHESGAAPALTLRGLSAEDPAETLILSFIAVSAADWPATFTAPRVQRVDAQSYRIESAARHWRVHARALYVHRDVSAEFFRAVPPRPVPLGKRLFWRVVLGLARRRGGLRVLSALRRR